MRPSLKNRCVSFPGSGGRGLLKCFQEPINLLSFLIILDEYPDIWMSPGSNVQEENQ